MCCMAEVGGGELMRLWDASDTSRSFLSKPPCSASRTLCNYCSLRGGDGLEG